jgi:hypothetical protein
MRRNISNQPSTQDRLLAVAVTGAALGLLILFAGAGAHALQAAGLTQNKGSAIAGVDTFVANLTDNVKWLVATGIGLAIAIVGLLFMSGHSRAHDIAIKAGLGAAIIVGLGGIAK